ncbi:MAG: 4Fe-4S binding protein [Bacillota bacterium]
MRTDSLSSPQPAVAATPPRRALPKGWWRRLRLTAQLLFLGLLLLPLAGVPWFTGTFVSSRFVGFELTDPFAAAQVLVAGGALAGGALLVLLLYLLLGRAFCSWVCPLGTLLEWLDHLPMERIARRSSLRRGVRWALALGLLGAAALLGIALFEWISPQATLMRMLLFGAGAEALILALVISLDLFVLRRGWCRSVCPAGAAFSLLGRVALLRVGHDREACNRCANCVQACPMDGRQTLLETVSGRGPASSDPWVCTNCGLCIDACDRGALRFQPAWAIGTPVAEAPKRSRLSGYDRRQALTLLGGAVAVAGLSVARPLLAAPEERPLLRPPGALPEAAFLGLCLRCGQCAQACPRGSIKLGHIQHGLSLGTPYIEARENACDLCRECVPPCPTGALTLEPEAPIRMGTAVIDTDRCLTYRGDVCRSCFVACPLQGTAIVLEGAIRPAVNPELCTGCGLCEQHCIMEPAAIVVRPVNEHA